MKLTKYENGRVSRLSSRVFATLGLCLSVFFCASACSAGQSRRLFAETPDETAARIKWFTDARFGMFIHFGAYSLAARHEWTKNYENLSDEEYDRYVENFDPDMFDAKEWVQAAKDAGMK